MNKFVKIGSIIMLALVLIFISACSSNNNGENESGSTVNETGNESTNQTENTDEGPLEISFMAIAWSPPKVDTPIQAYIEEQYNVKLDPIFVPSSEYDTRQNVALTTGDIPDFVELKPSGPQVYTSVQYQAIDNGLFADLTPYIKSPDFATEFPNLAQYPAQVWETLTYNGKIYGIPKHLEPETYDGLYIREDLLDKKGLEVPTTVEELSDTIISLNNPPSMYGLDVQSANSLDSAGLKSIAVAFTGVMNWAIDDNGEFYYQNFMPEYKDYLLWLKNLYDQGAIHPEFSLGKDVTAYKEGKSAVKMHRWNAYWPAKDRTKTVTPFAETVTEEADTLLIPPVKGPEGYSVEMGKGFYTQSAISAELPEEKVRGILKFIDSIATDEFVELIEYGNEGVYHEVVDGVKQVNSDLYAADCVGCWSFVHQPRDIMEATLANDVKDPELFKQTVNEIYSAYESMDLSNPHLNLVSTELQNNWGQLTKDLTDNRVKVVMGTMSLEEWDEYVIELTSSDIYKKIQEELKASLEKSQQ